MTTTNVTPEKPHAPSTDASELYQEAALNLRLHRITAITPAKLERAMVLLKLGPDRLVQRGLASRSSPLAQDLDRPGDEERPQQQHRSSQLMAISTPDDAEGKQDLNGTEDDEQGDTQDGQDDGWGDYEDYDSDSDIDDDGGQDDKIEGRREGPIYAFLVYGGVQLRPDEYVLLFRTLGVSPQYVEELQCSNSKIVEKPYKSRPDPVHPDSHHPRDVTHLDDELFGPKASPLYTYKPDEAGHHSLDGRGKMSTSFSRGNDNRAGVLERMEQIEGPCTPPKHHDASKVYNKSGTHELVFKELPKTPTKTHPQLLPTGPI